MPELPEVETVLRGLKRRVLGRRIESVEVRNPLVIRGPAGNFARSVSGCRVRGFARKGKALVVELENGDLRRYLLIRLGMTGRVTVEPRTAQSLPHTHVILSLAGGAEEIRYQDARRFGRLYCCTQEELDSVFRRLGPDAPVMTEKEFLDALRRRRGAIKSWLMNQQIVAGLGNIYADEALFEARIHPLARPGSLSKEAARRLHRAVKRVLDHAVKLQGTSFRDYVDIEGRPGSYRPRLRVYQRTGEPCRRCGAAIRRIVIAGRSSHFCPACQPRPRRVAVMRGPRKPLKREGKKIQ